MVLGQIGGGYSIEQMLEAFPYLEREDILEAILYGAWLAQESELSQAVA